MKDISCQHEGIEDLRIKRRLRSHESRGVEPSFDPRVKVGTNQEPMDELRFSLSSGQEFDTLSAHLPNVERLGHRHQGSQTWIQRALGKGLSPESERTSFNDTQGKCTPDNIARTIARDLGDSYSSSLPAVSRSQSMAYEAQGPCMQQAQSRMVGSRADGRNMTVLSDSILAGNNSSEPYMHEDRRRLLEHDNEDHGKFSDAVQSNLPSDTCMHEDSSYIQHAPTLFDTSDLAQRHVQHADAFLEKLGSDLMGRGSEEGDTQDKVPARRATQSNQPTVHGQRQLIPGRCERLGREYGRNPAVRGRGSVLYRSSPFAKGEETAHTKKLGYGSDAPEYEKTMADGFVDSRRVRSEP